MATAEPNKLLNTRKLRVTRPADFAEFSNDSVHQAIHQRFEAQVELFSGNRAVVGPTASLTYGQLNARANTLAHKILSCCGKRLKQVGILLPNSAETLVCMLACLKAHKAYVPLDYGFPKDRLRVMLEDAEASVVLTDNEHFALAEQLLGNCGSVVNISQPENQTDAPNPEVYCDPLDRAYILYTSGSTGRPKGIAFAHRNLLHTTMCLTNALFFSPSDRVTWLHSASFAASVVDIYCSLTNGGTLYPWDVKTRGFTGLAQWFVQEKITTFQWIPSAFRQFLRTVPEDFLFRDIRIVVMASEPLTAREVDLFRRHFSIGSHLVNQLGTSESYNYRLYPVDHQIPIEEATVPGGYPVSEDRQVLILDEARRPLPTGSIGEIAIKSDYMSLGYWRDEALNHNKFVRFEHDEVPVFLTGDLGKLEPDGRLIHFGRKDFQVKIRGYRIELAEVDHALSSAPGVADSVTWIAKNRAGQDQLVAYVIAQSDTFDHKKVEQYLETRLPDYMVPRHFILLHWFPVLPTGKIDRSALPNPFEKQESHAVPKVPSDPAKLETQVVGLFKELLQCEDIDRNSSFIKWGGDSLLIALLAHRIQQQFHVELACDALCQSPTPAGIASMIIEQRGNGNAHGIRRGPASQTTLQPPPNEAQRFQAGTSRFTREVRMAGSTTKAKRSSNRIKNLIIIGAGQFGREILTWAVQAIDSGAPWAIKGFLDDRIDALRGYDYPARVLSTIRTYEIHKDDVFIGAIADPKTKLKCYQPILEKGGRFVNVIHPSANLGNNIQLGLGIVLGPFCSITCDVKIGNHVTLGAFSNAGHDTVIGDCCQISSHCGINGCATLGDGVFLGSHACILPRVKVGAWGFVGAGSVVVRDIPGSTKVFGNPATVIGRSA